MPAKMPVDIQASFQHFMADIQSYIQSEVARQLEGKGGAVRAAKGGAWVPQPPRIDHNKNKRPGLNTPTRENRPPGKGGGQPPRLTKPTQQQASPMPRLPVTSKENSAPVVPSKPQPPEPEIKGPASEKARTHASPMWEILKRVTNKK